MHRLWWKMLKLRNYTSSRPSNHFSMLGAMLSILFRAMQFGISSWSVLNRPHSKEANSHLDLLSRTFLSKLHKFNSSPKFTIPALANMVNFALLILVRFLMGGHLFEMYVRLLRKSISFSSTIGGTVQTISLQQGTIRMEAGHKKSNRWQRNMPPDPISINLMNKITLLITSEHQFHSKISLNS